jgi:uncharacterized protein (TIGR02217 family)
MTFCEELLDLGWDYGAQGGPEFAVTTTLSGGGYEFANLDWAQPKGEWQIGDRTGDYCLDLAEYEYLYKFWMARRGSFEGFRYKDWGDFELKGEQIGIGDGTRNVFQITKTYGSFVRVLSKIAKGATWQVGSSKPAATLDYNTGLLTFAIPPALGQKIKVTGEFHVPVKFIENKWPGKFYAADPDSGQRFYELGSLQLRGIRV